MARMMSRFPNMVARYMPRKMLNRRYCCSGLSERPKRRNSVTVDWLFWSMIPLFLERENRYRKIVEGVTRVASNDIIIMMWSYSIQQI